VIVTLATVGYGDFYLKTHLGRILGLVVCFWGTFVVSYFVVTVTNMLTFAPPEEKSYTLLLRLHYKEELKRYAVNVLTSAFRHRDARLKKPDNEYANLKALRKFRGNMLQFQQAV
jgi:Ion channel